MSLSVGTGVGVQVAVAFGVGVLVGGTIGVGVLVALASGVGTLVGGTTCVGVGVGRTGGVVARGTTVGCTASSVPGVGDDCDERLAGVGSWEGGDVPLQAVINSRGTNRTTSFIWRSISLA